MIFDRQTQLGLIRGILAEPDEDAPRLVYADWLEDQGDPLCELVRVQMELRHNRLPRARRDELQRREQELLGGLGFDRQPIPAKDLYYDDWRMADGWDYSVSEGLATLFIHGLAARDTFPTPLREWVERFGWFFIRAGIYDSYEYRYELDDPVAQDLFDSPLMEHCIGLDLHLVKRWYHAIEMLANSPSVSGMLRLDLGESDLGAGDLLALTNSPHLSGLLDLDISKSYLGEEAVLALAASEAIPSLRRLRMAKVEASAASMAALAKSPWFPRLRCLDISRNRLDLEAVQAMAEEQGPANLVELDVSQSALSEEGLLKLIRSPRLARLRRLGLSGTAAGTATVEMLCQTDRFFRWGELDLGECLTTDESLAILGQSPHASWLRMFVSTSVGYTDTGAKALVASPHLKNLIKLDLSRCRIGPEGAQMLSDPSAFPQLEELTLRYNPVGDRGAQALAKGRWHRGEITLLLDGVGLTAAGVAELVGGGHLAGLVSLDLGDNSISEEGIAALARCSDLQTLRHLEINRVGLTNAGANLLAESPYLPREMTVWAFHNPHLGPEAMQALQDRFEKVFPSVR